MNAAAIWLEALAAGKAAADAVYVKPIVVRLLTKTVVSEGVCGFAWITIHPARGEIVKYLKSQGIGSKSHQGGYMYWVSDYGQSMVRKEAHAQAMANALQLHGLRVFADSRMD